MKLNINKRKQYQKGFNLIELMITIVIIAILVSIALPSYSAYVIKTHRTAIKGDLESFAQALEKRFIVEFSYLAANGGNKVPILPELFPSQGPISENAVVYNFVFEELSQATYLLEAIPIPGTPQEKDGKLTIDNTGKRCWFEKDGGQCKVW